jgi:hypothetical protein
VPTLEAIETVNVVPATVIVDPVLRLCCLAYPDETSATSELASELRNVRPEMIFPELSTPTLPVARSTPSTLNELILNEEKPPPPPPPPGGNPPPPDDEEDGIFPEIRVSVSVSPPAAAET